MRKADLLRQINRLAALGPLPGTDEAKLVLAETLGGRCTDLGHAERAVAWCCENLVAVPKPIELADACEQTRAPAGPAAKPGCPICGGSGFETVYQLHTLERKRDGKGVWTRREPITGQPGGDAWRIATDLASAIQERRKRGESIDQYVVEGAKRCWCLS